MIPLSLYPKLKALFNSSIVDIQLGSKTKCSTLNFETLYTQLPQTIIDEIINLCPDFNPNRENVLYLAEQFQLFRHNQGRFYLNFDIERCQYHPHLLISNLVPSLA